VRAVLCLLALGLLVTGCASTVAGSARPVAGSPSRSNDSANNYGAPKVTTPMDTRKYWPNPCSALTQAQLTALGVTQPTKIEPNPTGNICHFSPQLDVQYAIAFTMAFGPGEAKGLGNVYQIASGNDLRRLPDIDGQPVVTQPSQNTEGECTFYLGATDDVSYGVSVSVGATLPHFDDPCTVAKQIAEYATTTMKSGG
jgi:hypothetical protein